MYCVDNLSAYSVGSVCKAAFNLPRPTSVLYIIILLSVVRVLYDGYRTGGSLLFTTISRYSGTSEQGTLWDQQFCPL